MNFFEPLDGHVILRANGIYSEHQLYHHNYELFARKGNGYIRLLDNQATSRSRVFWSDMPFEINHIVGSKAGRMVLEPLPGFGSKKTT